MPAAEIGIMSPGLARATVCAAVVLPLVLALWWGWRAGGGRWRRIRRGAGRWILVVACQGIALVAVFLPINGTYGFYTSWGELLGEAPVAPRHDLVDIHRTTVRRIPISKDNPHPDGLMAGIMMPGTDLRNAHVPVWLPPQYFEHSESHTRFPVLYWIGGVDDTGDRDNISIPLIGPALQLIKTYQTNPFVIAFLPGEIRGGQDTECTDVGGIDQQSWLMRTAIPHLQQHYRVGRNRASTFIAGFSTGGYCAANFSIKYHTDFRAGFGLAPYFHPVYAEPQLSQVSQQTRDDNSPIMRVKNRTVPANVRFLSVMSTTDRSTWSNPALSYGQVWADGQDFWNHAHQMPQFSFILTEDGGHQTGTYTPYVPESLRWLGQYGL
ncbi:MAG: alpha/beta hydrolase-fold protein [Acidipropionibacterium sp.]|jgi:hypothetical protein|nr:alpha/beta hydrolase-fold protein [Acidipropionibacterium sp.]